MPAPAATRLQDVMAGAPVVAFIMEFQRVVNRRRMVRNYDPDRPVPDQVVDRLLRNALHAPSAGFSQGWAFLVLREPGARDRFWTVTTDPDEVIDDDIRRFYERLRRAPLIIVCFSHMNAYLDRYAESDKGEPERDQSRWPVPYWDIDTGMAALLILLTAVDEELGACFFGVQNPFIEPLRHEFGVPDGYHPIGAISVGYPADDPVQGSAATRRRRGLNQVVHHGRW